MGLSRTAQHARPLRPFASAIGRAVLAVLCLAASGGAVAAQETEPVREVLNRAEVRFGDVNGTVDSTTAQVVVAIDRTAQPEITGSTTVQACVGDTAVFAHAIRNAGNVSDRIALEVDVPAALAAATFHDVNGDGIRQSGDSALVGGLLLAPGEDAAVLIEVRIEALPATAEAEVVVSARSTFDPAVVAQASDVLELCAPARFSLELTADRTDAVPGDTLTYTIAVSNIGEATSGAVAVTDTLPAGLVLIDDATAGRVGRLPAATPAARAVVSLGYDSMAAGEARTATVRALITVADTTADELRNRAWLEHGSDTVSSDAVITNLHYARVVVSKQVLNGATFREGEIAEFGITWQNTSDAALRGAVLTDSLPDGLRFVSASPTPARVDGRIVEWHIGSVEPGSEGSVTLETLVEDRDQIGVSSLVNRATLSGGAGAAFASAAAAGAAAVDVRRFAGDELAVRLRAGALEVSAGDAVAWTVEVENTGTVPLVDVIVAGLLPRELERVPEDVAGVDSVTTVGGAPRFHLSGALAPGEVRALHYRTVVLASGTSIGNRALATAEAGTVASDTAVAALRVRNGPAAPARTLIGRVWVDVNDNRVQDDGEPGVAGVDVWTADGVVVRTDEHGRFSLQDLEPGVHTLRVDTFGIGGLYRLPANERISDVRMNGWTAGRASIRLIPAPQVDPSVEDHAGPPIRQDAPTRSSGAAHANAHGSARDTTRGTGVSIAPLRSAEDRAADRRRELTSGPGVTFVGLEDGQVFSASRMYLGARGEPGASVRLFDGDSLLAEAVLRPDGVHDFVALPFTPGTHRLRLTMRNSWGNERGDSIRVHRSGAPHAIDVVPEPVVLRAESQERRTVVARILDEWAVPVTTEPYVSIAAEQVAIESDDADAGSVGLQVRADADGWVRVEVRPGQEIGPAEVAFMIAQDSASATVDVIAPIRPLIVTGSGRIGLGATDASSASVTARGALDEQTSITLSYDSDRPDEEAFLRANDALDESFYPTTGDGSQRRVLSGSTQNFTARIQRDLDWVALGDVRTEGFADAENLASYDRSVGGVAARIGTGDVVWHAFGSASSETLAREQIRGDGTSGPYRLGGGIRPGTERLALEVRARENAARTIARTGLHRELDYQIDYASGEVLLERPIPSTDPNGNPIFLVADVERRSGETSWLGGVRADVDVTALADIEAIDSLGIAVSAIRDGADAPGNAAIDLTSADLTAQLGDVGGSLELVHGATGDSSAIAARASVAWDVREEARIHAEWLSVGSGFAAGANPRLRAGLDEVRVGARMSAREGTVVGLEHERQSFGDFGIERNATYVTVDQELGERGLSVQTGVVDNGASGGDGTLLSSRATLHTGEYDEVWIEANRALGADSSSLAPSHVGIGASHRILPGLRVVGSHRQVWVGDDSYAQTELTLRAEPLQDGAVWGGVTRTGTGDEAAAATHAAAFGWSQRLRLGGGWVLSGMFERRMNLEDASLVDPIRAMPFSQREADQWSASAGAEWRTLGRSLSGHGEIHDGELNSGYRFEMTGDVQVGDGIALLTRHDWLLERREGPLGLLLDRRDRSLLGLAVRPTGSDALNALARLEWRRSDAPVAPGVLTGSSFRRLIGTFDLVWAPQPALEAAFRYAVRGNAFAQEGFAVEQNTATSHHLGAVLDRDLDGRIRSFDLAPVRARLDGRLLYSATAEVARWSLAPSLVYELGGTVEIEAGWRFGDLEDIDFARSGAAGAFASVQVSFTEQDAGGIADFWRERIRR